MSNFPTLSLGPLYPITELPVDAGIRTPFESGYTQSRPKFSRITRKWPDVIYRGMTDSDKNSLFTFENTTVRQTDSFTWVHPYTGTSYTVRFGGPIEYSLVDFNNWNFRFVLEEV